MTKRPVNLTVRITDDFQEDLDLVCSAVRQNGTKLNKTEAVQYAIRLLADTYRRAWDYGDVMDSRAPELLSVRYACGNGMPETVPNLTNMTERSVQE
jgi:hypothetical protein